jgi:hypothetical protein
MALVSRSLRTHRAILTCRIRCFHINYPFCGIGFLVAACFVRMNATTEVTFAQKLKQTDWVGAFLFIGSFTSFLVGLSFGGVQHPWTSAATLAPLVVGVAGIGAFLGWQVYRKPHSLLPMSIFYNWSAIAAFYNAMINGLVVSATPSFHVAEKASVNSKIIVANRASVYMHHMQTHALTASCFPENWSLSLAFLQHGSPSSQRQPADSS